MPGPLYRDPWAAREAWRKHPIFSRRSYIAAAFPGLGYATVAFTAYVIWDDFFRTKSGGH